MPEAEHAGTDTPAPAFCVHWEACEVANGWALARFADIKIPAEISNPPINITAGIISFLDKNVLTTN